MSDVHNDIVVTGLAAISAAGVGVAPLRDVLRRGESMLQPVPADIPGESGHLWGRAEAFKAADFMPPLKARKFDRCSLFAVVAAGMALKDADVETAAVDAGRIGIALGCGFGGIANSEEFLRGYFTAGIDGLIPMLFPNTVPNAPASNASIEHKLKGPNVTTVQRFCSAESAFMMACRFLAEDRADIVLTGGVDELTPLLLKGFRAAGQLRGFGAGFGEGAGIMVLERGDHARRRNVHVVSRAGARAAVNVGREYEPVLLVVEYHEVVVVAGQRVYVKHDASAKVERIAPVNVLEQRLVGVADKAAQAGPAAHVRICVNSRAYEVADLRVVVRMRVSYYVDVWFCGKVLVDIDLKVTCACRRLQIVK